MRTLVTGGAGFIGSHVVRRLLDLGDDVVVLDSIEEQVHASVRPDFPDDVELVVGDVGDPDAADKALARIDRVVHLAAVVGVGQSMYEIDRYTRKNTMATATFLERLVAGPRPGRLVVASSMSIYGEGEYECNLHGRVAPGPRPEAQLAARTWECTCPHCGDELRPVPTSEAKPLIPTSVYAVTKRDHEELSLVVGAAHGISTVALRFFNVYGPGQALSNPYTGVAAIFASRLLNGGRRSFSRTAVNPGTSSTSRTSSRGSSSPSTPPSRSQAVRSTSALADPSHRRHRRRTRGWAGSGDRASIGPGSIARGTSGTALPTRHLRGSCWLRRQRVL